MKKYMVLLMPLLIFIWQDAFAMSQMEKKHREFVRDAFYLVSNNYKNRLAEVLSDHDRRILYDTHFIFNNSRNLIFRAYINFDKQRIVEISYGFLTVVEMVSYASHVARSKEAMSCYAHFVATVAMGINYNSRALASGRRQKPFPTFPKFVFVDRGPGCDILEQSDFDINGKSLASNMDAVMVMVLGHELAHHIHGDTLIKHKRNLRDLRLSEYKADAWALERAFEIRYEPTLGVLPTWYLFSAMDGAELSQNGVDLSKDGIDLSKEVNRSHPMSIRRVEYLLSRTIEYIQSAEYEERFETEIDWESVQLYQELLDEVYELAPDLLY